jgi:pyruvate,orthophosphate dikinase
MMRIAIERGRKTRPDLKIGICGEHGGDPSSIAFCHEIGLTYVSPSTYRVPVARLAAAQAAIAGGTEKDR